MSKSVVKKRNHW